MILFEDLLDDFDAQQSNAASAVVDTTEDWTSTDYYDMLIMIPWNSDKQHSISEVNQKCQLVEYILTQEKHITDYSRIVQFANKNENTCSVLEEPFVRPISKDSMGCLGVAIKYNFTNVKQIFRFITNLARPFAEKIILAGTDSPFTFTSRLLWFVKEKNGQWDAGSANGSVCDINNPTCFSMYSGSIDKFIKQNYDDYDDEGDPNTEEPTDDLLEIYTLCRMFIDEKNILHSADKYYPFQFGKNAFNLAANAIKEHTLMCNHTIEDFTEVKAFVKFRNNHKDARPTYDSIMTLAKNNISDNMFLYKSTYPFGWNDTRC